ncbi:tRNA lysidine(34) synthetase TilS [Thalassospiraceae bacterium LMO-JJ14]|nr:tRNA lysidine(34) synthetase TilS [Thalassospiraceae bacterium LMO-JJ14]
MSTPPRSRPVTADEFDQAMRAFAPFERTPHVAVAVSGGADSTALVYLAHAWAEKLGGYLSALIVDHGLRPESAGEAALTAERLRARGIRAHILEWTGAKPDTGIQAAARQARYTLMDDWCRRQGVLHLMLAHHADDQAETFMMRVRRGSGPDGLAAMAPVRMLSACRVLRPLLGFPKSRLNATLEAEKIDWLEDPSNVNPKYARTAIRNELAASGADVGDIVIGTRRFARARRALETETARWLAQYAELDPAGFIRCERAALFELDEDIRLRVLARMTHCIGGKTYAPEIAAVERLMAKMGAGQGGTLGGARFEPAARILSVYREARNLPASRPLMAGITFWDGRFIIQLPESLTGASAHPWSPVLGADWPKSARPAWYRALPAKARPGVPVIRNHDGYHVPKPGCIENNGVSVRFAPTMPLSGGGFSVA